MVGAWFFSMMDLKSGFWQVKMAEKSRQYTAFTVGSMGIFEFLWMPYGLCNTPATFQRLMQNCLGEFNLTYALIYLDDVIIFSRTEEEHLILVMGSVRMIPGAWTEAQALEMSFSLERNHLLGAQSVRGGYEIGRRWP